MPNKLHYDTYILRTSSEAIAVCGKLIKKEFVTTNFQEVTCKNCLRLNR